MLSIFPCVCYSSVRLLWRNVCLSLFSHFLIGLFVFLVLSCMSCLYVLEINPLSVVALAIIFSHSKSCLFTLLIASFSVQKLFKFNQVPLVYFCFYFPYSRRWVIEDLALCNRVFCLCFPLRVLSFLVIHLGL